MDRHMVGAQSKVSTNQDKDGTLRMSHRTFIVAVILIAILLIYFFNTLVKLTSVFAVQ